jgi:hypothetical protein
VTKDHRTKTPRKHRTPGVVVPVCLSALPSIYPTASLLGGFLILSFFSSSIIARIAIAIGNITFNRSVPVNAAVNDS